MCIFVYFAADIATFILTSDQPSKVNLGDKEHYLKREFGSDKKKLCYCEEWKKKLWTQRELEHVLFFSR